MAKGNSELREWAEAIIIAIVLTFFIITFVAQSFVVEGRSMLPTLKDGERLFINKFIYRFKGPERGDIIVFEPQGAPGKRYIKRVIGLPGETVYIKDYKVYINGEPLEEDYILEPAYSNYGPFEVPAGHVFVLGDNRNNSTDSRYPIVGYVEYDRISGEAFWVYWPINRARILHNPDYSIND